MRRLTRRWFAFFAVATLGLLALIERPLAAQRPRAWRLGTTVDLPVTSPQDGGPGSLREAILAADRAPGRPRIAIRTDHVTLETPLPPLVNRHGVVIEAESNVELDARALAGGPVLDIAAPGSLVHGVTVKGAGGAGVLVRASGVRLQNLRLLDCDEGVHLAEGVDEVTIADSAFVENGTGVRVETRGGGLSITGNQFDRHGSAAVWAVSAQPPPAASASRLLIRGNRFEGDRMSIVLINVPAEVTDNRLAGASEAAIFLTGPSWLRGNRIQRSALGVFADAPDGASIDGNELDHNRAVAILLRGARGTEVRNNRVYANGYGIAVVFGERGAPNVVSENLLLSQRDDALFVVGGAPVLRDNRALGNRGAGLRVLDYVPRRGPQVPADPLMQGNVLEGNGHDLPARGLFHEPAPPVDQ
jgi:parallel beta-helix repeat protein